MKRVLIIGGSVEAWHLACSLDHATVWLPEPERVARAWPCPVTQGALPAFHQFDVMVIACHPCDGNTARMCWRAAKAVDLPVAFLRRSAWRAGSRDRWVLLRSERSAAAVIPTGARVLTTLGRQGLGELKSLKAHVLARRLGAPGGAFPLKHGRFLPAKGPFSIAQEECFLRKERVDWLLLRNAGGPGGWPKLAAARQLGLSVAMVARPAWPGGVSYANVAEAKTWIDRK